MPRRPAQPPPSKAKPPTQMDAEHAFKRRGWTGAWMWRFRDLCMAFPEAAEVEQFGGPWYKAGGPKGKAFAAYGAESEKVGPDEDRALDGAAFNVTPLEQSQLVKDPRFTVTHYVGRHGWTTMRWDGEPDWDEVAQLVEDAYRKVANARMLRALDAGGEAGAARGPGRPA